VNSPATPGGIVSCTIALNVKLSVHARHLYTVLCCFVDERREIVRSKSELIDDTGFSRATVHRAMTELTEAGIVEAHSSIASDGGTRTNLYRLRDGGLCVRPPQAHTETPGVSGGDPLKESPAQTPVSEGDPGGSQRETGEGVSEGDGGSLLYKKGESSSLNHSPSVPSPERSQHTVPISPERPAPEETRPMTMLDFNNISIPTESTTKGDKPPRATTRLSYDYDEQFLAAWEAYGKVGKKQAAWQAWKNATGRTSIETIMAAIPHYLASDQPQRGFTQHLSTWLNNDGWESAEAQPKKPGYQGRAGSDARPAEDYEAQARTMPIHRQPRHGLGESLEICRAWYYHWNLAEQREWTREQLLATGNTPEDVDWLMDAYAKGIDPELYAQLVTLYSLTPHGSDA
jgi:DNA-binding transcriptional ArsR family regulator